MGPFCEVGSYKFGRVEISALTHKAKGFGGQDAGTLHREQASG